VSLLLNIEILKHQLKYTQNYTRLIVQCITNIITQTSVCYLNEKRLKLKLCNNNCQISRTLLCSTSC